MGSIAAIIFKTITMLPAFIQLAESFFPAGNGSTKLRMVLNMLTAAHAEVPALAKMGADLTQPLSELVGNTVALMNATGSMNVDPTHVTNAIAQAGAALSGVAQARPAVGGTELDAITQSLAQLTADVQTLKAGGAAALAAVRGAVSDPNAV